MAELTSKAWIDSAERVDFERRIVRAAKPASWVLTKTAQLFLLVCERERHYITTVRRALVPGQPYDAYKIGHGYGAGPISTFLDCSMIDELPHLAQVEAGEASLIGPRATTPEHRANLFAVLEPAAAAEWEDILLSQKPGLLSSYALPVHQSPGYPGVADRAKTEEHLYHEAHVRLTADRHDFNHTSRTYDRELLRKFSGVVLSRATGGRIGSHGN